MEAAQGDIRRCLTGSEIGGRLASARRPDLVALPIVIAVLAVLYVVLAGNGWAFDDNLYLTLARENGLTVPWLFSDYLQHFGIAYRAAFSVQGALMPLDYRWALIFMLLLLGVSIFVFVRILEMLLDAVWIPRLLAAHFGLSVLFIHPLQWWSSALQSLPTVTCDLICLYAYLRYDLDRSQRWLLLSSGALGAGLLFYEKPAYTLLYIALLRVFLLSDRLEWRAIARSLWCERRIWMAYVVVIVLWLIGLEISGAGNSLAQSPSASEWLAYFKVLWAFTLVPAVFGLTLPPAALTGSQTLLAVGLEVVVLGAVVVSILRKSRAWRAWAILAICVITNAVLVGQSRLVIFGPATIGGDTRFLLDFTWLMPLLVGIAFSRRAVASPVPDATGGATPSARRWLVLTTAVLAAAYAFAAVRSAIKIQREWQGHEARLWEDHLLAGFRTLLRAKAQVVVADDIVPGYILAPNFYPFNTLSAIVPDYVRGLQFDGPLTGRLAVVDQFGNIHAAAVGVVADRRVLSGGCGTSSSAGARITLLLPRPLDPSGGPYYVRVSYRSVGRDRLPLFVARARAFPSSPRQVIALAPGVHQSIAWTEPGPVSGVSVQVTPGLGVCVRDLQLVVLAP